MEMQQIHSSYNRSRSGTFGPSASGASVKQTQHPSRCDGIYHVAPGCFGPAWSALPVCKTQHSSFQQTIKFSKKIIVCNLTRARIGLRSTSLPRDTIARTYYQDNHLDADNDRRGHRFELATRVLHTPSVVGTTSGRLADEVSLLTSALLGASSMVYFVSGGAAVHPERSVALRKLFVTLSCTQKRPFPINICCCSLCLTQIVCDDGVDRLADGFCAAAAA